MKKIIIILILIPAFSRAQKLYLQQGAGFMARSYSSGNGYLLEFNAGIKLGALVRLGAGISYLKYARGFDENPHVPVYVDLKLVGKRKFKPYIFLQPGYSIYKSNPIFYYSDDMNQPPEKLYFSGGFTVNTGFGVIYKFLFLQIGFRMENTTLKVPSQERTYNSDYSIGFTAGFNVP